MSKLNNYIDNNETLKSKQKLINSQYDSSKTALDDSKRQQEIKADLTRRRLMKYMPQLLKYQGLSGNVGASESAMIDVNNKYTTSLGRIEADYRDDLSALNIEKNKNMLNLYNDAQNQMEKEESDKKQAQIDNYNMLLSDMENWGGDSISLEKHIDKNKPNLSEDQYNNLVMQYKANATDIDYAYNEKEKNDEIVSNFVDNSRKVDGLNGTDKGQNFHVKIGTKTYDVQVGYEYTGSDSAALYKAASDKGISDGEVFYHNGKVYLKAGEKLYNVEKQPNKWSHDDEYKALVEAMAER